MGSGNKWSVKMGMLKPGDHTIVAFGDSTTAPREAHGRSLVVYPDILREELPGWGITGSVMNKGVPGHTTVDALDRFNTDVVVYGPDWVIIQFGINDSAVDLWQTPPATSSRVSLASYSLNLTTMVQQLKATGCQVMLMTPNPMLWTKENLDYYGKTPYHPDDRMGFNVLLKDYAQVVRNISQSEQIHLLDVYSLYLAYDQGADQRMEDLLLDGMHPNESGHRFVADALISSIHSHLYPTKSSG
jgi:lysophospholipase L1-like esterase